MQTISGPAAIVTAMKECPGLLKPRQTLTCRNDVYSNPEKSYETIKTQIVDDILREVNLETAQMFEEACEQERHEIIKYLSLRSVNEQQITALFLKLRNRPDIVLTDLDRILGGVFFDKNKNKINELGRRLMRMLMVGGHHPETIVASLFDRDRNRKRDQTSNAMTRTFGQYFSNAGPSENHEVGDVWWYEGDVGTGPMVVTARGNEELVRARLESKDNDVAYKISRVVADTYQKTRSNASYQSHRNEQSYFGELDHEDLLNNNNYGSFFNHIRPVPHQTMPSRPAPHNLKRFVDMTDMTVGVLSASDDRDDRDDLRSNDLGRDDRDDFVKNKQRVMSPISGGGSKIPKGLMEEKLMEEKELTYNNDTTRFTTTTTPDTDEKDKKPSPEISDVVGGGLLILLFVVVFGAIII